MKRRRHNAAALQIGLALGGSFLVLCCAGIVALVLFTRTTAISSADPTAASLPSGSSARFNGQDVNYWGERLLDANPQRSQDAARALSQMGDESLRWFRRGLESNAQHVKLYSLAGMSPLDSARYKSVFEPIMLRLLDTDFDLVMVIAKHLAAMKSETGRATLTRRLAEIEPKEKRDFVRRILDEWGG